MAGRDSTTNHTNHTNVWGERTRLIMGAKRDLFVGFVDESLGGPYRRQPDMTKAALGARP